jgi:hypothetical protein
VEAPLVSGVDAGTTATRCLVVSAEAELLGRGEASGANIRSSGGQPEDRFAAALRAAPARADPARVRAGVFGVAGGGAAGRAAVRVAAQTAWRSLGLAGVPRVVTDLEVAFAAGTAQPDGLLLLAGTGAAAASFARRRIVRRCDGYGWLLGDQGSAVWLGLRGVPGRAGRARRARPGHPAARRSGGPRRRHGRRRPAPVADRPVACGRPGPARPAGPAGDDGRGRWRRRRTRPRRRRRRPARRRVARRGRRAAHRRAGTGRCPARGRTGPRRCRGPLGRRPSAAPRRRAGRGRCGGDGAG